jgi:type VI secretion system secreted protein Hcp
MPTPAYLTIEGSSQGAITQGTFTQDSVGNVYQEGHEDEILIEAFSHQVTIPRDPQSGQPTGQRVHQALVVTKVFDKCSPLLYTALTTGEMLTTCQLKFYRTSSDGQQEHYFTIELQDAIIVDIKAYMPNCQDPGQAHFTNLEDVSFSYRMITWTHEVAGTSGSDDWRAPRG